MGSDSNKTTVIVGGGIIGSAVAFFLAEAGHPPLVLDAPTRRPPACAGAAGMLGAVTDGGEDPALREAGLTSVALYRYWAPRLECETGISLDLDLSGILDARTGALIVSDGQVTAARAAAAFRRAAENRGAVFHADTLATALSKTREGLWRVTADGRDYDALHLVLAAGAWSGRLLETLGIPCPIFPARGQLLYFRPKTTSLKVPRLLPENPFYLVPKADGTVIAGTTVEPGLWDADPSEEGIRRISEALALHHPEAVDWPFLGAWAGLRPATPDGRPLIGPVPGAERLWLASGHFRRGILLAPFTGREAARALLTEDPSFLRPFLPARLHDRDHGRGKSSPL